MTNGPWIGEDVWGWAEAPKLPPKKRSEPDGIAEDGLPLSAHPGEYFRYGDDGRLQQLWVYKHSSGRPHSYEWIPVL